MSLLDARALSVARGGRMLAEHLDIALAAGGGVWLTGPNGSGKSSLMRVIAGLLAPAAGSVETASLAFADSALALDRDQPLGLALAFWCEAASLKAAIEAMGISHLVDVPVRMLSTGQAQRARIARVAASDCDLWLLDEPMNGLDSDGRERLSQLIAGHRTKGGAVVLASHVEPAGDWQRLELGR